METRKKLVGARIKELRRKQGLSQDQLSERIKIEAKYLSRIETGKSYPSLDTLENIADALSVEMKELFDYNHLVSDSATATGIEKLLAGASKEETTLIYRLVKAVRQ